MVLRSKNMTNNNDNPSNLQFVEKDTSNIGEQTNRLVTDEKLAKDLAQSEQRILEQLGQKIQEEKGDFIAVISIFASAIAFLTIEFQFLRTVMSAEKILGFSLIMWSLLISFNMVIFGMLRYISDKHASMVRYKDLFFHLIVVLVFLVGVYLTVHGNEEKARENKIYERFVDDFGARLDAFEKKYAQQAEKLPDMSQE